jgi:uncharacterized protein (TIGR00266 family)
MVVLRCLNKGHTCVRYEIRYKPAFATVFLTLNPGESITAEAGAMASMDGQLTMATRLSGNLIEALMKKFLGGESFFVNAFTNQTQKPLQVVLTQSSVGDIEVLELKSSEAICFQPGAYIAHTSGIQMSMQWAGLTSWFSGEGLFRLKLKGPGLVFFGGYGGISKRRVEGELIIDNGHLVAYSPNIRMKVGLSGGLLGSMTSGEGFINRLSGQGIVYLQSRSVDGLVRFLRPKLR